jgi:hypothetical protein
MLHDRQCIYLLSVVRCWLVNYDRLPLCCGCNKQQNYSHYRLESLVRIPHSACVCTYGFLCFVFLCRWRRAGVSPLIRVLQNVYGVLSEYAVEHNAWWLRKNNNTHKHSRQCRAQHISQQSTHSLQYILALLTFCDKNVGSKQICKLFATLTVELTDIQKLNI